MRIHDQLIQVRRTVDLDPAGPTIALTQAFPVGATELWNTCTSPEILARWFEPVEGTLAINGNYRLTASGTTGRIERCEAPRVLTLTWEYAGDVSHVALAIHEDSDGALLTLRHTGAEADHWAEFGPAAGGMGWDEAFLALALLLDGYPDFTVDELQRLLATPEGREFFRASATAWCEAHVTAGADPKDADEAARRAYAFYAEG